MTGRIRVRIQLVHKDRRKPLRTEGALGNTLGAFRFAHLATYVATRRTNYRQHARYPGRKPVE